MRQYMSLFPFTFSCTHDTLCSWIEQQNAHCELPEVLLLVLPEKVLNW